MNFAFIFSSVRGQPKLQDSSQPKPIPTPENASHQKGKWHRAKTPSPQTHKPSTTPPSLIIILIRIPLPLLHNPLPKPTPSRIKLLPILIPNLPPTLSPTILPPLRETLIQIAANNPLIQLRAADVFHAVQRVLVRVVLDEAEAAGRFVEAIQAHDQPLDAAAFPEELVDLLFSRVEAEVADVEGCGVREFVDRVRRGGAVVGVAAFALVLENTVLGKGIVT